MSSNSCRRRRHFGLKRWEWPVGQSIFELQPLRFVRGQANKRDQKVLDTSVKKGEQVSSPGQNTDVFIVGAGPAGLAAAIAARQKGFEVVVADGSEPPIEKPCGEGMMPGTLAGL